MKNSLSSKGLSMSQAQSISNLCNQRAKDITAQLADINNAHKTVTIDSIAYIETQGISVPSNVVELLTDKARLSATQAFLMENIKAKEALINSIKRENYISSVKSPDSPKLIVQQLPSEVTEDFGWDTLTIDEYNEFLEAESYASHIGQFIHKGGKLDRLRAELPTIKTLEFMDNIEAGKRTPLTIKIHHTAPNLLATHEELATLHRGYEQKVNYFKSKIKNATTTENARIQKLRGEIQSDVNKQNLEQSNAFKFVYETWLGNETKDNHKFEEERQNRIKDAVNLKIEVSARFQDVVNEFLDKLK